jgi:hypothetical protein
MASNQDSIDCNQNDSVASDEVAVAFADVEKLVVVEKTIDVENFHGSR